MRLDVDQKQSGNTTGIRAVQEEFPRICRRSSEAWEDRVAGMFKMGKFTTCLIYQ
jgi:hypothetical protein